MEDLSLSEAANSFYNNFKSTYENKSIAKAANAINEAFVSLLQNFIKFNKYDFKYTLYMMCAGSYKAWRDSFLNTAAGHVEIGTGGMRRAIEFACYSMKITLSKNDEELRKRVKIWLNRGESKKHRINFGKVFSIPCHYQPEKYRILRPLILIWDKCSEFGVHANLASMIFQMKDKSTKEFIHIEYLLSSEEEIKDRKTLQVLLFGYRILRAFRISLDSIIEKKAEYDEILNFIYNDNIKNLSLQEAEKMVGKVTQKIFYDVVTDNVEYADKSFKKMINERCKK